MASTLDELEEIERSARVGPPVGRMSPTPPNSSPPQKGERRRGSSMFAGNDAIMDYKSTVGPNGASSGGDDLLEDFPKRDPSPKAQPNPQPKSNYPQPAPVKPPENVSRPMAPAVKRGSVALKPMSGIGGLVDFDDSDFDSSDEEDQHVLPGAPMPGSADAVGGPNHRPLVGGFAAAAYEAARAHHYANVNKGKTADIPKRRGPPPSI